MELSAVLLQLTHFRTSFCQSAGLGSVSDLASSGAFKILRDYVVGCQK